MDVDVRERAEAALAAIGADWSADAIETDMLDFKQTPEGTDRRAPGKFLKDLAESAVCFANGEGGVLLIGVRDRAATRADAIVGVDVAKWSIDELVANVHSRTSPSITPYPYVLEVDGRTVYALGIARGSDVYSTTEGVYKIRLQDRCLPLEGQQLRGLRALRQGHDWSAEACGAEWKDLSRAALERGARLLALAGQDELARLAGSDPAAFCKATGLAAVDGTPNRAAVLLYGDPAALRAIPEWGVNVQTRPSLGGDPRILMRADETSMPLVLLLDHLIEILAPWRKATSSVRARSRSNSSTIPQMRSERSSPTRSRTVTGRRVASSRSCTVQTNSSSPAQVGCFRPCASTGCCTMQPRRGTERSLPIWRACVSPR